MNVFQNTLAITAILSCLTLSACHQKNNSTEQQAKSQEKTQPTPTKALNCFSNTKDILSKIDQKSSIQQLTAANTALKKCVPELNHAHIYQLLESSSLMYQRFLTTTSGDESMQGLNAYGYAKDYPKNAQDLGHGDAVTIKKTLPQRDQYLMDQVGKQYIQFLDIGEGYFELKQHPQYAVDMFTAYLPKDEAVFIQRMAKDNAEILYSDASISIPWRELVERGLFWEKYIQQYPNSPFIQDAQYLYSEYEYLSFMGSDNSNTFGFSEGHYTVEETEIKPALTWLAKQPNSRMAKKAQQFLSYTSKHYPSLKYDDYAGQYKPLVRFLQLTAPDFKRDCHHHVLCEDISY